MDVSMGDGDGKNTGGKVSENKSSRLLPSLIEPRTFCVPGKIMLEIVEFHTHGKNVLGCNQGRNILLVCLVIAPCQNEDRVRDSRTEAALEELIGNNVRRILERVMKEADDQFIRVPCLPCDRKNVDELRRTVIILLPAVSTDAQLQSGFNAPVFLLCEGAKFSHRVP